jgi:hypothetical protein
MAKQKTLAAENKKFSASRSPRIDPCQKALRKDQRGLKYYVGLLRSVRDSYLYVYGEN